MAHYPTSAGTIWRLITESYRAMHQQNAPSAGERIYNSPWNIAADFLVEMSFNPDEIAVMLAEYDLDHGIGMNIPEMAQGLCDLTGGYPFLVSHICKTMDERLNKNWTKTGLQQALKVILEEKNTLFDDMSKNLESYASLYDFTYAILITGETKTFTFDDPDDELLCRQRRA